MDSVSRANGGIFEAERRLQQTLQVAGVEVQVVGLPDAHTKADLPKWQPLIPTIHPVRGPKSFGYAPDLFNGLLETDADLAYGAGLWKYPSLTTLRWSRRTGKPLIVAPHGMLDPWALENSRSKKQVAGWLFQNAQLRHAACLRALCAAEAQSIRSYGLKNPIAIIPNGIDLPVIPNAETLKPETGGQRTEDRGRKPEVSHAPWTNHIEPERKVLLFLSRIHPKKGLVNLLKAWSVASKEQGAPSSLADDWTLAIAGWDQGGHEAELKTLASDLGLAWTDVRNQKSVVSGQWSVVFLGPQFNDAKAACYANCDAFILPSFSEGLPMVVLEAWAYGKPVLMTPECNLPEGFAANAAIRIEPNVESISSGLEALFRNPPSALRTFGDNGRRLVSERFTWPKIANDMKSVYEWVLRGGTKPPGVV